MNDFNILIEEMKNKKLDLINQAKYFREGLSVDVEFIKNINIRFKFIWEKQRGFHHIKLVTFYTKSQNDELDLVVKTLNDKFNYNSDIKDFEKLQDILISKNKYYYDKWNYDVSIFINKCKEYYKQFILFNNYSPFYDHAFNEWMDQLSNN